MKQKEQSKSVGQIKTIKMNTTSPMKMENLSIDHREMSIMVGQNGTGKTLMLKTTYALGYIANGFALDQRIGAPFAQFVMDNTFEDQNFNGTIGAEFTCGADISVIIKDGHVEKVEFQGLEGKIPINVVFMSSGMRLFSSMQLYLKMRRRLGDMPHEALMVEMLKDFRLYDMTYIEGLIMKAPFEIPDYLMKAINNMDPDMEKIDSLGLDWDKPDFFIMQGEKKTYLSTLGNGHQALLNMTFSNLLR